MTNERLGVTIDGVDNLSPVLKSIESGVIRFVGAVSSALTVLSVVGFPVASAATFQQQLLEVKKTTDFTAEALGTLKTGLIELSKTTDVAVNELARIAALGGQMGVGEQGPAALLAFTEELSRAVTALDVSADQAAPALGKLVNIFNLPLGQFRNAVAVINELSNISTATAEEILDVQRRIGDLGGSVTFAQSAALSALAIDLGVTAETAGTSITKIFADMKSSAADFAAFMGVSTGEWIDRINNDGISALTSFLTRLNSLPSEVASKAKVELTGGGRIFELVTKMQNQLRLGDSSRMAILLREANREWLEGTSAIREQQNVLSGTIAQYDIFKNKVNSAFIAGGDQALRAINDILKSVGDTVSSQQFVDGFAGFIGNLVALGDVVVSTFASLSSSGSGSQVDWGTLFDIAGLLAIIGIMKTIPMIFAAVKIASNSLRTSLQATTATPASRPMDGAIQALNTYISRRRDVAEQEVAIENQRTANAARLGTVEKAILDRQIALQQQRAASTTSYAALEANVEKQRAALMTARAGMLQRISSLEERYTQKSIALASARTQAQIALEAAITSGSADAARKAQAQMASIGRQAGGANSYFTQAIARERAAMEQAMQGLTASYAKSVERLRAYGRTTRASEGFLRGEIEQLRVDRDQISREMNTVITTTTAFKRSWYSAFIGSMPSGPILSTTREMGVLNRAVQTLTISVTRMAVDLTVAYRTIGALGVAASVLSRGISAVSATVSLAGRAMEVLSSIVSRFFMAWVIFDIATLIADMLGWKDAIKGAADEAIRWVSKMTGLKLPTFGESSQLAAEAKLVEQQLKARERLFAQAEAFGNRFGKIDVTVALDDQSFAGKLANMEKSLAQFYTRVREGGKFGSNMGITSSEAFVEGVKGVVAFQTQLDALYERMKEIRELQEKDDRNRMFDPGEILTLEKMASTVGLTAAQQERLTEQQRLQSISIEQYLLRSQQLRDLEQQRYAVLDAQSKTLRASLSVLDESAATEWFGGDQLLRRLRDQKQIVDSLSDALNRMKAEMGPDAQTGSMTDQQRRSLVEMQSALNESTRTLEELRRRFQNTGAAIRLAGADTKALTDAILSGDIGAFLRSVSRDGAMAARGLQAYMQGSGNVVNTVKEQNRLASQLVFGREMARGYGLWADSAKVAAEQAKNAVAQAIAQNRRDLDALVAFFLEIDAKIKSNRQDMEAAPANRKIDNVTDRKLFDLDLERQKKQEIIDIAEDEGRISYKVAETRRYLLNKEYEERARKLREIGELQKSTALEGRLKSNFEEQTAEAKALQKEITNLTAQLNDPALTDVDRDKLISPLQARTSELEAKIAQMRSTISSLADIKPVGGSIVVTEAELRPLKDILTQLTSSSGALKVDGLKGTQRQMESLVNELQAGRANAEQMINTSLDGLRRMMLESRVSAQDVASNIAAAFSDPAIQAAVEGLRTRISDGLVDVAGIRYDPVKAAQDVKAFTDTWNAAAKDAEIVTPRLALSEAANGEIASLTSILTKQLSEGVTVQISDVLVPGETKANVEANPDILVGSINDALESTKFKVDVTANVKGSNGAVMVPANNRDGGPIRGAGTSRSDSILSWLSHGEFVMDALTVRMFGPGFFKFLQTIAKSGANLKDMVPGFNSGGYLGKLPSMVSRPAIATPAKLPAILAPVVAGMTKAVEEVSLDISFNGKPRAKVTGSREQVRNLTDALMELKRSM